MRNIAIIALAAYALVVAESWAIYYYYTQAKAATEDRAAAERDVEIANTQLAEAHAQINALNATISTWHRLVDDALSRSQNREKLLDTLPPSWGDCELPQCLRDALGSAPATDDAPGGAARPL